MIEITYPINGFNDAHEVIEEATRTGTPLALEPDLAQDRGTRLRAKKWRTHPWRLNP